MTEPIDAAAFIAPTFGQRLGGRLLDGLIVFVVFLALRQMLAGVALGVLSASISATYEIVGVAVWGQTIGKRIVGTRVVSMVGAQLEPGQAVVRFLAYGGGVFVLTAIGLPILGELWAFLVILPILRSPLHRGLHDMAARTIVVTAR